MIDFTTKRVAVVTGYYPTPVLARNFVELSRRVSRITQKSVFIFVYWWKDVPRPAFLDEVEKAGMEVKEITIMGPLRQARMRGWIRSPLTGLSFNLRAFRETVEYLKKEKFHAILLFHNPWYTELFMALCARFALIPGVVKFFTGTQLPLQWHRWIAHLFTAPLLSRIVVVSPEARLFCLLIGFLTPRYTIIRSLGVVARQFRREDAHPEKIREEFHLNSSAPTIGMVARIDPIKGHKYFLQALVEVKKIFPDIQAFIVGGQYDPSEPWEEQLKQLARSLHLTENVHFTGMREDVENFYSVLDVLVHPALYDVFPFSILEGMAMKLPVVASAVGGIPDMVVNNQTGILVPKEDPHKLAEAIIYLLSHPEVARQMGEEGYRRVNTYWTFDRAFSDTLQFLSDLYEGKPAKEYGSLKTETVAYETG